MAKYIIDSKVFKDGSIVFKVKHDINGNPRYIVFYQEICNSYDKALAAAREVGFHKCTKNDYNIYFIIQSYGGFQEVFNKVIQAREIAKTK